MSKYAELPWSVEDTIENITSVKDSMKERVILLNLHGRGEKDAEEVEFDFGRAIKALKENQKYKQLGTLEEVREAVEKQIPKSPTYDGDGYAPDGTFVWDEWICPNCGHSFEVEYEEHDYCPYCGQHINWSDER